MNLSEAIQNGLKENRAVRHENWPLNLAWCHGMDNVICWYNSDPESICVHETGDQVHFSAAMFWSNGFELHPTVHYHGDLHKGNNNGLVREEN